jgi:hypothetical protein
MNETSVNSSICPRCDCDNVRVLAASPVSGRWTMYICNICIYSWRSTEPRVVTDPLTYPRQFKINPAEIPEISAIPTVPPRRR